MLGALKKKACRVVAALSRRKKLSVALSRSDPKNLTATNPCYKQLKQLLILKKKFIKTHDELLELEKSNKILSDHPYFKDNLHVQWIKFFDNIELKIKEHFASNNLKLDSEKKTSKQNMMKMMK